MTQEEIEKQSEEYFCEHCENGFEHDNGHCSNCSKWDYFIAGAKWGIANAIEWHDLREDPNDLPKEDCETVTLHENGNKNIIKWKHGEWTDAIVIPVIAWYELPTYKE